jgi:DNA-binding IclR family transcriptional regulator
VLSVLLARKAARLLKLADNEALTNKEVAEFTGLASGTAAPSLKSLRELRLVSQDSDKAYYVPNAQLGKAIEFVKGPGR